MVDRSGHTQRTSKWTFGTLKKIVRASVLSVSSARRATVQATTRTSVQRRNVMIKQAAEGTDGCCCDAEGWQGTFAKRSPTPVVSTSLSEAHGKS